MAISNFGNTNILTVICDICFLSIKEEPIFQCILCKIDLCIFCFYDRLEISSHKNSHEYRVFLCTKKLNNDWTILEELIFFNGLGKYGIGNWESLSKSVGTKTQEEVELFFYNLFNIKNNIITKNKVFERTSNPFRSNISIYMNNRQDFDVEFMNDYEEIIKDMEFTDSDEEIDLKAKNAILKGYGNILRMRKYRKKIIIDKQLIDVEKTKSFEKKMSKYVDIDKYKFILEYLTLSQYKNFIYGIYKENYLNKIEKNEDNKIDYEFVLSQAEKNFCKQAQISNKLFDEFKNKFVEEKIFRILFLTMNTKNHRL